MSCTVESFRRDPGLRLIEAGNVNINVRVCRVSKHINADVRLSDLRSVVFRGAGPRQRGLDSHVFLPAGCERPDREEQGKRTIAVQMSLVCLKLPGFFQVPFAVRLPNLKRVGMHRAFLCSSLPQV